MLRNSSNVTAVFDSSYGSSYSSSNGGGRSVNSIGLSVTLNNFVNAESYVDYAQDVFKSCKKLVDESVVTLGVSTFNQLKEQMSDCNTAINRLVNKIDAARKSIMSLDSKFAEEYTSLAKEKIKSTSVDLSSMSEDELYQYNIRLNNTIMDYEFAILELLERLKANGELTPEILKDLEESVEHPVNYEYQKALCERYKILEQMSGVDTLGEEYRKLYKEYIEQSKNMCLYNPYMDEATKQAKINELETACNEFLEMLEKAEKDREFDRQQEQLIKLQLQKEYNNGFFHPGVELELDNAIIELRAEMGDEEALEYLNMSGWDKALQYTGTFVFSSVEGFLNLGEGVVDGLIYASAKAVQVVSFGHVDDQWAEDIISYDVTGNLYDWTVDSVGINTEIAYGVAKSVGNFAGETLGYYALSAIPYVGPVVCAFAGAGKKVEESMNYQMATNGEVDDLKVFIDSVVGSVEGLGAGMAAGSMRNGLKNLKSMSFSKDALKATMGSFGDISKQAAINTMTDLDTWVETAAVVVDDIYTGIDTGEWNWDLMLVDVSTTMAQNFIGNFGASALGNYQVKMKSDWDANLDSMTLEQKSKYWEDYFGSDGVEHTSGIDIEGNNGSFVDPDVSASNRLNYVDAETRTVFIAGAEVKTNLSDEQLIAFANEFYNLKPPITSLDDYPPFGVIENSAYLKIDSQGRLGVNWVADNGSVPGTRKSTTIPANAQIDRYGNPNGIFVGKMEIDANGNYVGVDYDARALPYAEGSQQYTKMIVLKDINSDSVSDAINALDKNGDLYKAIRAQLDYDGVSYKLDDLTGNITVDCFEASIAAAYGHNGGGIQYELPLRANYLKALGFLDY